MEIQSTVIITEVQEKKRYLLSSKNVGPLKLMTICKSRSFAHKFLIIIIIIIIYIC